MSDNLKQDNPLVWLIGTGSMAIAYAQVLKALHVRFSVIGRGQESADKFFEQTGVVAEVGGLEAVLSRQNFDDLPHYAIVSVNVDALAKVTMQLLASDVKRILVEKPAGLYLADIAEITDAAREKQASVYVGYNRRFYSSVLAAQKLIEQDGGILSCHFEFTEWSHVIKKLTTPLDIKNKWFFANSTHVIDLAFHLCGIPQDLTCFTSGSLPWHPSASIYAGSGVTVQGVLFSYQANWEGPGRWGIEIITKVRRYIFRPLEKLQVQQLGSVIIENYEIDDSLDITYKPGIYRQVAAFLSNESISSYLLTIEQHQEHWEQIYERMNP